jgi:RND family efflux transporter MFP subunit
MKPLNYPIVAISLAALLLVGCKRHKEPGVAGAPLPVVAVRAQTVEAKKRLATEETLGTVRPKLQARLEAKIPGRIARMQADLGQVVKAGDLLVHLDTQEIRAKLDQALAVQQQAESDLKRYKSLLDTASATQAEFDAVQARARVAAGAVKEAQTMLGYADVTAPFDGVVTRKLANLGDLAAPGKPLLDLEDPSHLRFETDVPDAVIGGIKMGATMPVRLSSVPGELPGTVVEIAPTADPNSRTFRVKLDLPPAEKVRAGQFGRAAMPLAEVTALRVPVASVVQRGQLQMVFVVADNHAVMRLVKAGKRVGDELEIASGLSPGERIVTEGAADLVDGQPVEVRP